MLPPTKLTPSSSEVITSPPSHPVDLDGDLPSGTPIQQVSRLYSSEFVSESPGAQSGSCSAPDTPPAPILSNIRPPLSRPAFFSFQMKSVRASMARSTSEWSLRRGEGSSLRSQEGHDVGSPGKLQRGVPMIDTTAARYAGEASVYYDEEVGVIPRIMA